MEPEFERMAPGLDAAGLRRSVTPFTVPLLTVIKTSH
jgi:hypothetical protein